MPANQKREHVISDGGHPMTKSSEFFESCITITFRAECAISSDGVEVFVETPRVVTDAETKSSSYERMFESQDIFL